ncbi:folate receptor alpha [Procambarus clarkii]|uniref:folate receptor alpha n=1 Tax=Procambarus clarkii TaxID=6728 RepID=UPI001E6702A3|nr:folate receptor alpha-like [Procambarus clarkii]
MSTTAALVSSGSSSYIPRMLCCLAVLLQLVMVQTSPGVADQENWCLDETLQKIAPGPASSKFDQCHQWQNRSCCTEESKRMNASSLDFNLEHCSRNGSMSDNCKRHFVLDRCFRECSPNVHPWALMETPSSGLVRYRNVPLCAIDCELWFKACAHDLTCTDNWTNNFRWLNMTDGCPTNKSCLTNYCPINSTCETIEKIYKTSRNFCEKVWDNYWQYTDSPQCMRLQFNKSVNPNDAVSVAHARLSAGAAEHASNLLCFTLQLVVIWALSNHVFIVFS